MNDWRQKKMKNKRRNQLTGMAIATIYEQIKQQINKSCVSSIKTDRVIVWKYVRSFFFIYNIIWRPCEYLNRALDRVILRVPFSFFNWKKNCPRKKMYNVNVHCKTHLLFWWNCMCIAGNSRDSELAFSTHIKQLSFHIPWSVWDGKTKARNRKKNI